MTDRQAEQAAAADVRRLVAAHVAELTRRAVNACPDCDAPAGAECAADCPRSPL